MFKNQLTLMIVYKILRYKYDDKSIFTYLVVLYMNGLKKEGNMKNYNLKHLVYLLLSLLLVATLLSGCSKKDETSMAPATEGQQMESTQGSAAPADTNAQTDEEKVSFTDLFKKAKTYTSFSYELEMVSPTGTYTSKVWTDNGKYKTEVKMAQTQSVSIISEGKIITYDPVSKMGMSYTMDSAAMSSVTKEQNPMVYEAPDDTLTLLGEEKMNGYDCYVIDTAVTGAGEGKLWISKEYGLMIRMETTDAASGTKIVMNCKNIQMGSVPTGTFDIPKDIKIIDAGTLPGSGN